MSRMADSNRARKWHNRQDKILRQRQASMSILEATAKHCGENGNIVAVALVAAKQRKEDLAKRLQSLSDDDLLSELRGVVTAARNNPTYDRDLARAVGEECRRRGILKDEASGL